MVSYSRLGRLIQLSGLILLAISVSAQDAPPRHDKYRDDPHAYCLAGKPLPNDKSGHECHCALVCQSGQQAETVACELYCTKARCACHPDDPCAMPPA